MCGGYVEGCGCVREVENFQELWFSREARVRMTTAKGVEGRRRGTGRKKEGHGKPQVP